MNDHLLYNKKTVVSIAKVLLITNIILVIVYWFIKVDIATYCSLGGVIGVSFIFAFVRYSPRLASYWSLLVLYGTSLSLCLLANPATIWVLAFLPSVAVAYVGRREAFIWSCFCITSIGMLGFFSGFIHVTYNMTLQEGPMEFIVLVYCAVFISYVSIIISKRQEERMLALLEKDKAAMLGTLAGEIAHQISNPMSIIMGQIKILRSPRSSAEKKEEISLKIELHAATIVELIAAMKSVSRDGKLDSPKEITTKELFVDILALSKKKMQYADIDFSINDNSIFFVNVQKVLMVSAFLNIISNSIDFLQESKIKNKFLRIEFAVQKKGFVDIRIIDAGKGITQEIQKKIFSQHFTTKDEGKGTGIGLTFAKETIEKNKGKLFLDTNCKNTCFVIRLPYIKCEIVKK